MVDQDFDNSFTVKVFSFQGNKCTVRLLYQRRSNLCVKMEDESNEGKTGIFCDAEFLHTL